MNITACTIFVGARESGLVKLVHQCPDQCDTRWIGSAQDQRVAARLGQQCCLERGIGLTLRRRPCAAGINQARHKGRQVGGDRMLQADDFNTCGIGDIQRGNDCANPPQVVCVIGDDEGVVPGIHIDGVVGADQWAQYRHQVIGVLMAQPENLRLNLTGRSRRSTGGHRPALQFGVCLGHHEVQAGRLHQRKTLCPQLQ